MLKRKKKTHMSRRIQLDDASADAYVAGLVEAAAAIRLPELFGKRHPKAIFSVEKTRNTLANISRNMIVGCSALARLVPRTIDAAPHT